MLYSAHDVPPTEYQWAHLTKQEQEKYNELCYKFDRAKQQRDQRYEEFDGMMLREWVQKNAETANSYVPPRKNASDVLATTGSAREKLLSIISYFIKLNISNEVLAFSNDEREDVELSRVFTDAIKKSQELEGDDLKKIIRWMYLLEQGTICVEEVYAPRTKKIKRAKGKFDPKKMDKDIGFTTEMLTTYNCERNIVDLLGVYFGNIREFEMAKQPYIFTRQIMPYDEAKTIYGEWDNWKYVRPGSTKITSDDDSVPYRDYRLDALEEDQVEIIKYQNPWCDEYQIMINGVMMLPIDFWIPWEFEDVGAQGKTFNIAKVVYEPISPFFVYGKSLAAKLSKEEDVGNEMLRLMISKVRQSFKPPMANRTQKVLSPRIFDAGTIWDGIDPEKIKPLLQNQGLTNGEFAMYNLIQDTINKKSVSAIFQGQQAKAGTTATEVLELQKQALMALGLTTFAITWLEERTGWLRLQNILKNWTKPIDIELDGAKKQLEKRYRKFSVDDVAIGEKVGTHEIEFTDKEYSHSERREMSYDMLYEERTSKRAYKKSIVSLPVLQANKYSFYIKANPKERPSDSLGRLMLSEEMKAAFSFFPQDINPDHYKQKFALAWNSTPEEMFRAGTDQLNQLMQMAGQAATPPPMGASQSPVKQRQTKPSQANRAPRRAMETPQEPQGIQPNI